MSLPLELEIQRVCTDGEQPSDRDLRQWSLAVLGGRRGCFV